MSTDIDARVVAPTEFKVGEQVIDSQQEWEKRTTYNSQYMKNRVTAYRSGHQVEVDETPGAERIRVMHKNGNYVEMHADGTTQFRSNGSKKEVVVGNNYVLVNGKCDVQVGGGANIKIIGDCNLEVTGNFVGTVGGNYTMKVAGTSTTEIGGTSSETAGSTMTKVASTIHLNP